MKIIKILIVLLVLLVIAQFFGPDRNLGNPESFAAFLEETKPSQQVSSILKESCFDCHSDVTRYPWYDKITPVNYWLASHVADGKKDFNISAWKDYSTKRKDKKIKELIEMVENREMPLKSYTYTHPEARLTESQIAVVVDWGKKVRLKYSLLPKPQ